jgi:Condensation domain
MTTIDRTNQANSTKNVAAIYPLTPMQQGMLFHTLYTPESTLYFEQLCCTLQGELDVAKFTAAWQQVADRHGVLRTAFIWENINKPLQVVGKVVNLPWVHYDWRSLTPTVQQEQFTEFLAADRQRGFILSQAPLMRFTLMRMAEDRYKLVWSYHHLLIDGWSLPTLMQEVFAYYEAAIQGESVTMALPRPYRDYVLWRELFAGCHCPHSFTNSTPYLRSTTDLSGDRTAAFSKPNYSVARIFSPASTDLKYSLSRGLGVVTGSL